MPVRLGPRSGRGRSVPAGESSLGSARASRAGDGALAITNFPFHKHCGEAPQRAREGACAPWVQLATRYDFEC